MWGLEKVFGGKATKKPGVDALAAEREAKEVIARAARRDKVPSISGDSGFPDTEVMPVASEAPPKPADMSRRSVPAESCPSTPVDARGLDEFRISSRDLEANLAMPELPESPLPSLPKVADPIAPNLWGADHVQPPKTGYQTTPVSDRGVDEFRMDPRMTEAALADPLAAMAHHKPRYDHAEGMYDKRHARVRTAPNANVASLPDLGPLEGIQIGKPDPKSDRDARWRQAAENFRGSDGSPVPASLRGGELPLASAAERLKERQRIADARSAEGLGIYNGRPPALPTEDEKWEAARRAAQEEDMKAVSNQVAAVEGRSRNDQSSLGARESAKEAGREVLRVRCWDKIKELRQMIVLAADSSEKELMQDVLDRSLENYKRDFGDFPVESQ